MKITSIRIKKLNSPKNHCVLGIASIELDNCLVIHDIQLLNVDGKKLISFPSKRVKKYVYSETDHTGEYSQNYEYTDIVHPSNQEFRTYVQDTLFNIYESEVKDKDEQISQMW